MAKSSDTRFNWSDPLLLEQQLTHEERMVRDTARCVRAGPARAARPRDVPPREDRPDRSSGRWARSICWASSFRSSTAAPVSTTSVTAWSPARSSASIPGFRSMMSVQGSLVMVPIHEFGTEAQKQKFLPKLATGEFIGCFGLTEPGYGSDPGGMTTRAKKVDGGYSLTGTKSWISNSPIADVFIIWAKDDADAIRGFILEKGMKGLSAPPIHGKVGLRTSLTGEVVMDDVFCPEENAFPDIRGLKGPFTCLNSARFGICWGAMGAAEDCWHRARNYVMERKQFGRPLAANQLIQKKLADMQTEIALGAERLPAAWAHEGRGHGRAGDHLDAEAQLLRQGARDRA